MNKTFLNITIQGSVARLAPAQPLLICGNDKYRIRFAFDAEWADYPDKVARFISNGTYTDVDFKGNEVDIPPQASTFELKVGVYTDGGPFTTTSAVIPCKPSVLCEDAEPSVENDKRYLNEARELVKEAREIVKDLKTSGITDVDELPTEDIDHDTFYRLREPNKVRVYVRNEDGTVSTNNYNGLPVKVHVVDGLPVAGEDLVDDFDAPTRLVLYFNRLDGKPYGYTNISGWVSDLGVRAIVVTSLKEVTATGVVYIQLTGASGLYYFADGEWHVLEDSLGDENHVTESGMREAISQTANAIKVKVTSTGSKLHIGDISPLTHTLKVRLLSDTITDFTGVRLERYREEAPEKQCLQVYEAEADGTVKGVTSLYPWMDLEAPEGVMIEVEYNQDFNATLKGKLDKVTTKSGQAQLYGVSDTGEQQMRILTVLAEAFSVALRHTDGRLRVADPYELLDAVNKRFLEKAMADKLDIPDVTAYGAAFYDPATKKVVKTIGAETYATGETLAMRGAGGTLKVGAPAEERDAVPLGYANERYLPKVENKHGVNMGYVIKPDGTGGLIGIGYGAPSEYTLVARTDGGAIVTGEPKAYNHATTKKYVDNAVARGAKRTYIDWKKDIESKYWFDTEELVGYRGTYAFDSGRYDVHLKGDSDSTLAVGTFTPDEVSGVKVTGDTDAVGVFVCEDEVDFYGKYIMYFWTGGGMGEHFLLDIDILENGSNLPTLYIHVKHIVL